MALMLSSLAANSMTTFTPGGKALMASLPGAEVIPFIGGKGVFDPLNLTPEAKEEVLMYREAELMHSRVAMMGAAGYLVQSHFAPMFDMQGALVIRHLDLVLQSEMGQAGSSCLLFAIFLTE